jgi:hypothetical protein
VVLFPLLVLEVYLNLSLAAFAFGPWDYPIPDPTNVELYVIAAHVALAAGYLARGRGRTRGIVWNLSIDRLVAWSSALAFLMIFPTSLLNTGRLVPDVVFGLLNPGEAYATYQSARVATAPIAAYVRMLLGPLLALPLPLTVFFWSSLSRRTRFLGVSSILGNVALYIAMAVNQGVALTVLLIPCYLAAAVVAGRLRPRRRTVLTAAALCLLAVGSALTFFATATAQREGSQLATGSFAQIGATADRNNITTRYLSDVGAIGMFGLTSYVGQGYYGLWLAMQKPFIPMWGIGHSTFLYRQAARITGNDSLEHLALPERISDEDGWTAVQFFQTIYPWFASDVGWSGTLVVVFALGWMFAAAWAAVLRGLNPFAIALFGQLIMMFLYFPALNAVLQGGEGLATFWGLAILWGGSRVRFQVSRAGA